MEPNKWPFLNFPGKPRRFWIYTRATSKVTIYESVVICMHWQPRARNTRSKSKFSTFPQRNITSQGHKSKLWRKYVTPKGWCCWIDYTITLSAKRAQSTNSLQKSVKLSYTSLPPSPLSMLRCDFKVTWLKQHCKKGGKTTWSKNTSASRFLNEFMWLRFMYLARSYFALNSLHLLQNSPISSIQKGVRIIYC